VARYVILFAFIFISVPGILLAQAGRKQVQEGNKLYTEQKYDAANNKYRDALNEDPLSPVIHFNLGNVSYKKQSYEDALKEYDKALTSEDILKQSQSYYNRGNTLFRMGNLAESILAYKRALELNPDDQDAKYNLEYVRALLKDNAEKQPQDQQQQNQPSEENEDRDQDRSDQDRGDEEQQQEAAEAQEQEAAQAEEKEISKEDAERILDALAENEKDQQKNRKVQGSGKRRVTKDW
jgi:tetratricopeptide (TPR) repeat protein